MIFTILKKDNENKSLYFKNVTQYILLEDIERKNKIFYYLTREDINNVNNKLNKKDKIHGIEVFYNDKIKKYVILSGYATYINAFRSEWKYIWVKKYELCDINKKDKEINKLLRGMLKYIKNKEKIITPLLKKIIHPNIFFNLKNKFKKFKSLKKKFIKRCYVDSINNTIKNINIWDILRYTIILPFESYTEDVKNIINNIEKSIFKLILFKNYWDSDDDYSGINSRFTIPSMKNIEIEIQFHTKDSIKVKEDIHKIYHEYKDPKTPYKIKCKLYNNMLEYFKKLPIPKNILEKRIHPLEIRTINDTPNNCKINKNKRSKINIKLKN